MSNPEGEPSPLASAIDEILNTASRSPRPTPPASPPPADEPYELPTIVPATREIPVLPDTPTRPVTPVTPVPMPVAAVPAAPVAPAAAPQPASAVQTVSAPATGWGDHIATGPVPVNQQLRGPGRRPRVRRVTRVIRHIDPWSTFKLALVFSLVGYLVVLTSGVLLWQVADRTGTLDNVERWFTQFGWETFELKGGEIFHNAWVIGLFFAVGLTGLAVLLATLFNLVSDIVGGIRVTVLEEEVVERTASSTRRFVVRRPPLGAGAAAQTWSVDDPTAPSAPEPGPAATSSNWSVDD